MSKGGIGNSKPGSGFSKNQIQKLCRKLDPDRIQAKEIEGKTLSYIEGWYAVSQANEIFGYSGWDRETVQFERVYERTRGDLVACGYLARVRIRVRAGGTVISREGSGWGWAHERSHGAAHEKALKTAETDATKRALATFGSQFGLALYDKDQNGDKRRPTLTLFAPDGNSLSDDLSSEGYCSGMRQLIEACKTVQDLDALARYNAASLTDLRDLAPSLRNSDGVHFADLLLSLAGRARRRLGASDALTNGHNAGQNGAYNGPFTAPAENFHKGIVHTTQDIELKGPAVTDEPSRANCVSSHLSENAEDPPPPPLDANTKTVAGAPNGSVGFLSKPTSVAECGMATAEGAVQEAPNTAPADALLLAPSKIAPGQRIDKSLLTISSERRVRDKEHLKKVRELPCTICGRQPSHAHHLKFAQPKGLSQKVSDEYVVPLCNLHHGDLHHSSDEQAWWKAQKVDPLPVAAAVWERHHNS